jgi:hypothetical protein
MTTVMTTVNYPTPVTVNGYSCKNCTEVDEAKKHIDPAHPKDGPYGVDAKDQTPSSLDPKPAVQFGGALAGTSLASNGSSLPSAAQGLHLNILA